MDPNLFALDWERTAQVLLGIVVLSFVIERALALIFESRWFVRNTKIPESGSAEFIRETARRAAALAIIGVDDDLEAAINSANGILSTISTSDLYSRDPGVAARQAEETLAELRLRNKRRRSSGASPIKELAALLLAWIVTYNCHFDAIAIIMLCDEPTWFGTLVTAAVIAGGSKASVKLFHDVMNIKSSAYEATKKPAQQTVGAP